MCTSNIIICIAVHWCICIVLLVVLHVFTYIHTAICIYVNCTCVYNIHYNIYLSTLVYIVLLLPCVYVWGHVYTYMCTSVCAQECMTSTTYSLPHMHVVSCIAVYTYVCSTFCMPAVWLSSKAKRNIWWWLHWPIMHLNGCWCMEYHICMLAQVHMYTRTHARSCPVLSCFKAAVFRSHRPKVGDKAETRTHTHTHTRTHTQTHTHTRTVSSSQLLHTFTLVGSCSTNFSSGCGLSGWKCVCKGRESSFYCDHRDALVPVCAHVYMRVVRYWADNEQLVHAQLLPVTCCRYISHLLY